jgi:peptidyl-prolyl cis-trans isomerase SurA
MKRLTLLTITFFGLSTLGSTLFASGIANRIIAKVGDQIILQSELQEAIDFVRVMNQSNEPDSVLSAQVLGEMIKNNLLIEQAKKETVEVARSEIDDEVEKNISLLKQKFPTDEQYQEALKKEGITERVLRDRYRDDIRRRLISQRLLAKEGLTNISVTPTEIRQFYNQHKDSIAHQPGQIAIAHILFIIKPSQTEEEAAQKKITEIYDIIARGGDFEEVVKSFSEDNVTKDNGGYLGNVTTNMLQPEVQAAISNLKAGEVSQPFRSRNSYEIIKVLSRKGDKIELSHLMIGVQVTRTDSLQVKKNAQKVRGFLAKGASFDSLAKIYSDDPMTRDSGGYLGEFLLTGLQEPFRGAIEKLPEGSVSEPVLSEHGYHLIKILTRQEDRTLTLLEMQDQIRSYLFDQELKLRLDDYLAKLAARTYIARF